MHTFVNYPSDTKRITKLVMPEGDLNGSAAALNASIRALTDAIAGDSLALGAGAEGDLATIVGFAGQAQYSMPFAADNYKKFVMNCQSFTPITPSVFSGSNYLYCADTGLPTSSSPFSIAATINTLSAGEIVRWGTDGLYNRVIMDLDPYLHYDNYGGGGDTDPTSYADGADHNVLITFDGSSTIAMYADGALVATITITAQNTVLSGTFFIGSGDGWGSLFVGTIRKAAVWGLCLSAADAEAITGGADLSGYTSGIWGWWPLDTDLSDASGNGHDLSPGGAGIVVNYPAPFANVPYVYGDAASAASTSASQLTITGANITGNIIVEGF